MATIKDNGELTLDWSEKGSCKIRFVDNVFTLENAALAELLKAVSGSDSPRLLLAADSNVVHRTEGLGSRIGRYLNEYGIKLAGGAIVLNGGEKIKSDDMASVGLIASKLVEAKIGVNDIVLAIGGGSLLDAVGYAAVQTRGGVKLVRVPTTPAAMIDAAYAMNAAVDSVGVKDALRVPCRPAAVVVDMSFAQTVLDGVWRGGVGEAVRHAAVSDGALMKKIAKNAELLRNRDADVMGEMIRACVASRVKKGPVDFAQWCAARLEAMSGYKLPHGYAIPISICIECAYAVARGIMKESDQELVCGALADCGALDGLGHSHHILSQTDSILFGLDAWELATGSSRVLLPAGVGKSAIEEEPDRELYKKVIKEFLAVSTAS